MFFWNPSAADSFKIGAAFFLEPLFPKGFGCYDSEKRLEKLRLYLSIRFPAQHLLHGRRGTCKL